MPPTMVEAINTAISTSLTSITGLFTTNLPLIFAIVAGLIGLGLVYRLIRKYIGKKA